jgi:hypothetical protein
MGEDSIIERLNKTYVEYIIDLMLKSMFEVEMIIVEIYCNGTGQITNSGYFNKTRLMLLFAEIINLLRIDDNLFNMVIDRIRECIAYKQENYANSTYFLDRLVSLRSELKFILRNNKNINLIDLDENGKK